MSHVQVSGTGEERRQPQTSGAPRARGFGAIPERAGVRFRVPRPPDADLRLEVLTGRSAGLYRPDRISAGIAEFFVGGVTAGDRYAYILDGARRPDPATRRQPEGVHGPSEVVDPAGFAWRHDTWTCRDVGEHVLYELHVGTFTSSGTFSAARERLEALRDLGITAIELMPIADFPGSRNWGYDGVCLFAPAAAYGRPDDLRALVDAAHDLGLAVILDVVYNHLGPEGAYLPQFHPQYLTERYHTPWGSAVNLDGPGSELVRSFIIDNAAHWIREYRLDGLRLDATHAIIDASPIHLVAELVEALREAVPWTLALYGEDHRNLAALVEPRERGGWGLDGVWADDFHHVLRRHLAGDAHGYYEDFAGTGEELARTMRQGWLFTGQLSAHQRAPRGTDPSGIPMHRFVVCLQNHDQIGNRATGDRLHHTIDAAAWRAASVVLVISPMTPLLFMGQEWAASTPFQYFTDLEPDLGKLVTAGRRNEFKAFPEFADPKRRDRIPDPQARATFERSRLNWDERETGEHGRTLALYTELLRLRLAHRALGGDAAPAGDAVAIDSSAVVMRRAGGGDTYCVAARLSGGGAVEIPYAPGPGRTAEVLLSTEDPRFADGPAHLRIDTAGERILAHFDRPGAVILKFA